MRYAVLACLAAAPAWLGSCGSSTKPPPNQPPVATAASPLAAEAVAGVTDPALRGVIADHWEFMMRWRPTWATTLGDHRYDDKLAPRDLAAIEKQRAERAALIARLTALDAARLAASDAETYALLRGDLEAERGVERCKFEEWNVDVRNGSMLVMLSRVVEQHVVKTPADAANVIARVGQGGAAIDATIENLGRGLAGKRVAGAERVRRAVAQLDAQLKKPLEEWAMAKPKWPAADAWPPGERDRQVAALRAVIASNVVPALGRLRDFLRDRVLPAARRDPEGLTGLPDGAACYRAAILDQVGLPLAPDEIHAIGLREIARIDGEIAALGKQLLGTTSLATTIAKLRTDPALYFRSREEIVAAAQRSLDRAKAAIPKFFSVLPKAECVMREIPEHEAPYTTIAYYRQPNYDGSKPGEYFVNTYKPETRARYEIEALTWHESIPGHHLQIAIAQELGALPAFRKLGGSNALVEGWALYTERLAEDMGLYTAPLDRFGKLSFDAWRAARLVVDTGVHAKGWTRAQAEGFMREHTALTDVNISNEVDRYIGTPGQALGYKIGQLEILKLRAEAQAALGDQFALPAFHAVVLGAGAVTLPVLGSRVRAWIAASGGKGPAASGAK